MILKLYRLMTLSEILDLLAELPPPLFHSFFLEIAWGESSVKAKLRKI